MSEGSILATKEDVLDLRNGFEKSFNRLVIWTVSTGLLVVGLIIAFLKFS